LEKITLFISRFGQPLYMEKASVWASTALIIVLAYSLAQLTWLIVPHPEQPAYVALSSEQSSPGKIVRTSSVDVAALNLFGKPGVVKQVPKAQPTKIVDTNLKLTLRGILASQDVKVARAIIADDRSRKEDLYRIGGSVPGGAVLKEVNADHVVLSRGGRLEILRLPKKRLPAGMAVSKRSSPSRQNTTAKKAAFNPNASLREVRDTIMDNPESLASLMAAEPQIGEDGKVTGFKLGKGQDARVLRRFGLRRGDIVTSVNGVKLNGMNKLPDLMKVLPTAQELKIEYERRGKSRSIVLNMNK